MGFNLSMGVFVDGPAIWLSDGVNIPMFNEKEVYKLSIEAVCGLAWPPDRFIIQLLDDSTDQLLRKFIVSFNLAEELVGIRRALIRSGQLFIR
ncbi:glucomannan 4-beta-mannosyltransferase 1-like isoform X2 [Dioscorea cayenensis subsp. rotundata]|uniref:Glucomannan 4-beta-mannosyltransferase 1-like isoform X2 n=1 Tax=Dioscorea cayennensis subsp. rotundata TaxID=55577 RepID=A0AB40CZ27_DIOCR|nr:glucomannan 4-beta-mannosyltransferase 1-like isoform X2 [Dioscorea cayenensis subsp. rotundata]